MRILVIEDQPEILQNIADYLELQGYLVDCAYDGLGGMHLAVTEPFDLIILDLMLPGMDGITAMKFLQNKPETQDIPVVAISANAMPREVKKGLLAGFCDYLTKPLDLVEFCRVVDEILQGEHTR